MICSMVMDAITRRSWPRMMSFARSAMDSWRRPSRRFAALPIRDSSVLMPTVNTLGTLMTVNTLGTLMRMFWRHRAFCRFTSSCIGRRDTNP